MSLELVLPGTGAPKSRPVLSGTFFNRPAMQAIVQKGTSRLGTMYFPARIYVLPGSFGCTSRHKMGPHIRKHDVARRPRCNSRMFGLWSSGFCAKTSRGLRSASRSGFAYLSQEGLCPSRTHPKDFLGKGEGARCSKRHLALLGRFRLQQTPLTNMVASATRPKSDTAICDSENAVCFVCRFPTCFAASFSASAHPEPALSRDSRDSSSPRQYQRLITLAMLCHRISFPLMPSHLRPIMVSPQDREGLHPASRSSDNCTLSFLHPPGTRSMHRIPARTLANFFPSF